MRRALGFTLSTFGRTLMDFVAYWSDTRRHGDHGRGAGLGDRHAPQHGSDVVGPAADGGADLRPPSGGPGSATEIPPSDLLPHHYRRVTPASVLRAAAGRLLERRRRAAAPLRGLTWHTLIGLLAVTGLRIGEACGLDHADVDLDEGV